MIKGRFTVTKTSQGDKELSELIRLLAPMLEQGRIKVKEDEGHQYTHVYVDLYTPEQPTSGKKYL